MAGDGNGRREEDADVRVPGNYREEDRRILRGGGERFGALDDSEGLKLTDENARVGEDARDSVEKKVFGRNAVRGVHRGWGDGNDTGGTEFLGDAKSDGCAHGVAGDDGAVGKNHAAGGETAEERRGTGFGLYRGEGTGGMAVTGEIRDEDAKAEFGETAREVLHDEVIGGNAVEEDDGVDVAGLRKVRTLHREYVHAAGGGVDDVALLGVTARGIEGKRQAEDE